MARPVRGIPPAAGASALTFRVSSATLIGLGNVLRKLRSFFATAISVNPPCNPLILKEKNTPSCIN